MGPRAPLADLAAIVSSINVAVHDRARVSGVLDVLGECEIFDSVIGLGVKDSFTRFVAFGARGNREQTDGWKSWPLRRLFDSMMIRRIAHPQRSLTAIAIPLDYGAEHCVVLATLSSWAYVTELEPFFTALESFAVPRHVQAAELAESIPMSPVEPRVASYALCAPLQIVVDDMLARRGWSARSPRSFQALQEVLENSAADVVFWDLDHDAQAFSSLLRAHAILPTECKIVAFGSGKHHELRRQALVDEIVEHDAGEAEIFAALKRFARQIPELRKTRLRSMACDFEMALRDSRTPEELSVTGARHAANIMSGWASVHLVSAGGITYSSEHPRQREPVLSTLPKAFLSDSPIFQLRADKRFYEEVSDDRRVVGALERLHPLSAASIPLRHNDLCVGALLSVSRGVVVDSTAFEALEGIAGAMTHRFADFSKTFAGAPRFERTGVWECVSHGALEFAAYRSRSSAIAWDYRLIRPDFGLLVAGDEIDFPSVRTLAPNARFDEEELDEILQSRGRGECVFLAVCNPIAATVTYAATGFPVPLLFDASGPAGAISARGSVMRGTVAIVPPAGLLVWDSPLQRWLVRESVEVQSITETLEDLRPPGVAIVITNSGRR